MKLNRIYSFLEANRQYNHAVQAGFYKACIKPYNDPSEKATSLLFHILNTQSQPKLKKVAEFWQKILSNEKQLSSFTNFARALGIASNKKINYESLFHALSSQPGWGDKTSALFIKSIYHIHYGKYNIEPIWYDVPKLEKSDRLFLPVDAVIIHIFKNNISGNLKTFKAINKKLHKDYEGREMEVWDDLWFWGFITQETFKTERQIVDFNDEKYWAMLHSDKNLTTIKKIKEAAAYFKNLLHQHE